MSKQTSIYSPRGVNNAGVSFAAGDTTVVKDLIAAGSDDSLIRSLSIVSADGTPRVFNLYLNNGTTDFLLGAVAVPANAGTNGTVPVVDAFSALPALPLDARDRKFIPLKTGWKLRAAAQATVSGTVTFVAIGEDY